MTRPISWSVVAQWIALTLLGLLLAGGFHFPGGYGLSRWNLVEIDLSAGVLGFIFGAVTGLFIAGLQALLLWAWALPARNWLLLNALAYGLVHAVADAVPYRPFTTLGGGLVVAVCQYLALRPVLTRPAWWLLIAAGAWWLAFGLTAGPEDYNYIVVMLVLAGASGLALRLLLIPTDRSAPQRPWPSINGPGRVLLVAGLITGVVVFLVVFAAITGLLGAF
jgi:hypothetical protein